jgi:hypothetical protein
MASQNRTTAGAYAFGTTMKLVAVSSVALVLGGVGLSAGVGTATADDGGHRYAPVSSYPAQPTWPAPPTYPKAATWPKHPTWPAASTWPGASSNPCCSR